LLVEEMFARIERLNEDGLAILLIEQNVDQSLEIARHAYVLESGAIAFHGTPAELLANSELERAYLGI
jgi:branched-chain amino acid transport system ATP-binding protein